MHDFIFCTKECWPGVTSFLKSIEAVLKIVFPGCRTSFYFVPVNGFDSNLINQLKNHPPRALFIGGWDVGMRNIVTQANKHRTKTFLVWCSPITQTDLGMEIPLFIDVVNFLKLNLINYVSVVLESDYKVLKNIHEGFVYTPISADFSELDKNRRSNLPKEDGVNCDIFCAPNTRKNIFMQIMALSVFEEIRVHFNYNKAEYIESAKRYLKKHKVHPWMHRHEYLELIQGMDFGMQVSLSEGYNLATAEHMYYGIPVICSEFFPYMKGNSKMDRISVKDPTNCTEIHDKIKWLTSLDSDAIHELGEDCKEAIVSFNDRNISIMSELFKNIIEKG